MTINKALEALDALEKTRAAYFHAIEVIAYDAATAAPRDSAAGRSDCLAVLSETAYSCFINEATGELLDTLSAAAGQLDPSTARRVEKLKEEYDKVGRVPMDEYIAFSVLRNESEAVWHEAKNKSDYASFEPYLGRIVETLKRFAGYYKPGADPYNVWLSEFEEGLEADTCDRFFSEVRSQLVPLIKAVGAAPQVDNSFIRGEGFPVWKQRRLSDYLMEVMTLDRARCALGETEHPFTTSMNNHDVRITTHYYENEPTYSLYSVVHEGGHALFEAGVEDSYNNTCLRDIGSMALHESQSRFFENVIGRSEGFLSFLLPKLKELFPERLGDIRARQLYLACNRSEPSLIRTEADELTYSLHVMVRYELERALFDGSLSTKDLPGEWNRLYKEYLGIDVPDDRRGVLQDSHWSGAAFGYFPSYAIGSAYSAQLLAAIKKDLDVDALTASGELAPICGWLGERIWRHGGLYKPSTVIERTCGQPFSAKYYTDYLKDKFSAIYAL